jgi:hypothetical protein
MKNYLLITLLSISFLSSNAQKNTNPKLKEKAKNETLKTNLTKDSLMNYIKLIYISYKYIGKEFIKKVEDNMEFDKMYMEIRGVNQKFLIIPMKNIYFSQHAINQTPPIQYVVVVESDSDKGKISSADFVLVFPKDKSISVLPKNAFRDLASQNITQIDATYTYINFGDVKQFEMKVENGKRKQFKVWRSKNTITDNCKDWTLATSTFNDDGTLTDKKENLGKTCTECPPGFKCDSIKK